MQHLEWRRTARRSDLREGRGAKQNLPLFGCPAGSSNTNVFTANICNACGGARSIPAAGQRPPCLPGDPAAPQQNLLPATRRRPRLGGHRRGGRLSARWRGAEPGGCVQHLERAVPSAPSRYLRGRSPGRAVLPRQGGTTPGTSPSQLGPRGAPAVAIGTGGAPRELLPVARAARAPSEGQGRPAARQPPPGEGRRRPGTTAPAQMSAAASG